MRGGGRRAAGARAPDTHWHCAGAHIVPTQHLRSGQVCPSGAPVQVCAAPHVR